MENKVLSTSTFQEVGTFNRKLRGTKEVIAGYKVIDLADDGTEYVDCRVYTARKANPSGTVLYALIWVSTGKDCEKGSVYTQGSGSAGGCGYDKKSAAIGDAIRDAGIELESRIDGVGDEAIEGALKAIAEFGGCKAPLLVKFYA